jgi:hypothetical protein
VSTTAWGIWSAGWEERAPVDGLTEYEKAVVAGTIERIARARYAVGADVTVKLGVDERPATRWGSHNFRC